MSEAGERRTSAEYLRKKKRRRRVRVMRGILKVFVILWGMLGLIGFVTVVSWILGRVTAAAGQKLLGEDFGKETTEWDADGEKIGEAYSEDEKMCTQTGVLYTEKERADCRRLFEENPTLLTLVNKERELDIHYDPALQNICNGRLQASSRMYRDLAAMLQAAGMEGYDYWIASAYRSRARQQELIDKDVNMLLGRGMSYEQALEQVLTETMPAGHSEHETGLALDILCSGNTKMDASQELEPGNRWLVAHCAEYGFILRYPRGKEEITQIKYEPWHFRYVGKDAAEYIMSREITLEDFFEIAGYTD